MSSASAIGIGAKSDVQDGHQVAEVVDLVEHPAVPEQGAVDAGQFG